MLYLSYNLNFTPCFLLIRGPYGAPNSLIIIVTGQTAIRPRSPTRCSADQRNKKKKKRRSREMRGESKELRKYELSMCHEQMENNYFMVIVWCLILNCKNKLLMIKMGWIIDEWNRNRSWGGDLRGYMKGQVISSWKQGRRYARTHVGMHIKYGANKLSALQRIQSKTTLSDGKTQELLGQKGSLSLVDRRNNLEKQFRPFRWGFYC